MNHIFRVLLGMSLIVLLIPVASFALTGTLDAWLPISDGPGPETVGREQLQIATPLESDPIKDRDLISHPPEVTDASNDDAQVLAITSPDGMLRTESDHTETTEKSETGNTEEGNPAPSTTAGSSPSTTSKSTSTSKAPPNSETSSPPSAASGATITGDACPCQVSGTSELKGTVNLKGDITVDGGTLIARPGVTVNGNGHQIMFMNGGRSDFQGSETFTWSGNGSNANLDRDITFRNMRRIMFHQGAGRSTLRYFSVVDSGTSALGDYPIHFHLNGNSTRGTLVEGVAVVNGKHHAFVPHGSHGITFKDTIALDTRGDAYWWDPPGSNNCDSSFEKFCTADNSNDIVYNHALVDGVDPLPGHKGHRLTGFVLGAGSGNVIKNSVAINVRGKTDCSAFQWPEGANQNVGGTVWSFSNNRGNSNCHGIFVWQNDSSRHLINGFTGGGVKHGAYKNAYEYRNLDVAHLIQAAVGASYHDSSLGHATMISGQCSESCGPVSFTNVTFDSFTVDDAGKPHGARYEVSGSNIQCSDVIFKSMHPDSNLYIDGERCEA